MATRVVIESFDLAAVGYARDYAPEIPRGVLRGAVDGDPVAVAKSVGATLYNPSAGGLTAGVVDTLHDLKNAGCQIVTIGQYLRPSLANLPMSRYYSPAEFAELKRIGLGLRIRHIESGPLVRSSYHAHEQTAAYEKEIGT